jgi:hypothetical protein
VEDPKLEFSILESVGDGEQPLTQRSISKLVGRSLSSVNFALRLLAAKGYIKISGANPRKLRYSLTPQGVIRKSVLAYNFLVRQSNLYDEVRNGLIKELKNVSARRVKTVSVYGWTPFTETAILFLVLEGIAVQAIYVKRSEDIKNLQKWNRIPVKLLDDFEPESEVLILMEMLPRAAKQLSQIETVECFPET